LDGWLENRVDRRERGVHVEADLATEHEVIDGAFVTLTK
jgi:hypothetical protein